VRFAFERNLSVKDEGCVATAGKYGSLLPKRVASSTTLPACDFGDNIPDHFENLLPSKLIAKGVDDGR
jgi:hypothetical protein